MYFISYVICNSRHLIWKDYPKATSKCTEESSVILTCAEHIFRAKQNILKRLRISNANYVYYIISLDYVLSSLSLEFETCSTRVLIQIELHDGIGV